MNTMWAMVTRGTGGTEQLDWCQIPRPEPVPGQVLLKVLAAGINNTDINTRVGWYAPDADAQGQGWNGSTPFPLIQGADCCGRVIQLGPETPEHDAQGRLLAVGQRVLVRSCMRTRGFEHWDTRWLGTDFDGAFAEYVCVPASEVFAVQSDWSDAELATLPCAYATAENMLQRAAVHRQDVVLVTGATGGVGSASVQLALARGAQVVALTTSPAKAEALRALGAHQVLVRGDDVAATVRSAVGDGVVSVLVDNVAGPDMSALMGLLARGARICCSGAVAGAQVAMDLRTLYLRDLRLLGSTAWDAPVFPAVVNAVEAGRIRPLLAATYALQDMARAQDDFLTHRHIGKLVLVP